MPVVIQPHAAVRLEGQESAKKRANQRHKAAEHWNGTGDDVGDDDSAGSTTKPSNPMDDGVLSDVLRATEYTKEDVLCWQLVRDQCMSRILSSPQLTCESKIVLTQSPGKARP